MIDLNKKIAIVTGGSRGIGAAISRQLAACGAHVVICSRTLASCEKLVTELTKQKFSAQAERCDTGDREQIQSLIDRVSEQHGTIDVLVNNAAANPWFGSLLDLEPEVFQQNVDVNLQGTLFASIYAGRVMRNNGGGSIIHIGSINAVKPVIGQGIYSICKGGIATMVKAMAKEFAAHSIRVNEVAPGITKTDALRELFKDSEQLPEPWRSQVPMKRHAVPEEIAGAVAFLASDQASYITGARITADGGLTL